MAWVKFEATGKSFAPRASLNSRGYLSFNNGAQRRWKIDQYEYAVLHYDPDEKKIGIEFTNVVAKGTIKMRKRPTGATIGAKAFMDYFDIKIETTKSYDIESAGEDSFVSIDLNKGVERKARDAEDDEDDEEEKEKVGKVDPLSIDEVI